MSKYNQQMLELIHLLQESTSDTVLYVYFKLLNFKDNIKNVLYIYFQDKQFYT